MINQLIQMNDNSIKLHFRIQEPEKAHVRVAVLVYGIHRGVEHVRHVVIKNFIFSQEEPVLRYDNLLSYSELNPDNFDPATPTSPSPFLVGPQRDTLKVQLIILPQRPYRDGQRRNKQNNSLELVPKSQSQSLSSCTFSEMNSNNDLPESLHW